MKNDPALVHFCGHGGIFGREEHLLLSAPKGEKESRSFGRPELRFLSRSAVKSGLLFKKRPLIVLNACWTGMKRFYGGRSEDLVSNFLAAGASAVISCGLPMIEGPAYITCTLARNTTWICITWRQLSGTFQCPRLSDSRRLYDQRKEAPAVF